MAILGTVRGLGTFASEDLNQVMPAISNSNLGQSVMNEPNML